MPNIEFWPHLWAYNDATGWHPRSTTAAPPQDACPFCSNTSVYVWHSGQCPRLRAIEYHPDGTIKRIEFNVPEVAKQPESDL